MPNYNQAPKLYHLKNNFKTTNFYQLPQGVMDKVFQNISGREGNLIKLITVLLGTLGNGSFGVSEAWICERTGMSHETYIRARQALCDKGWIYREDGKLYVLVDAIMDDKLPTLPKEEKIEVISNYLNAVKEHFHPEERGNLKSPQSSDVKSPLQNNSSDVKSPQGGNMTSPIINNNRINNSTNKEINNLTEECQGTLPTGDAGGVPRNSPPPQEEEYPISGEISRFMAISIAHSSWITENIIYALDTKKYFRVKEE